MDVVQAVSGYLAKMVSAGDSSTRQPTTKMKTLLLDRDTVPIVSTAITQSALLNHEVYLIDRLDNMNREKMRHLRCLCFVRPSANSIQLLIDELRDPRYGEYNLYFSNVVKKSSLERLAQADDHEVVKLVQEYFADFVVINPDLLSLNMATPQWRLWGSSPDAWNADALQRTSEGIIALLLTVKKRPLVRYARNSLMAKKLASEVRYHMTQEEQLFDFRKVDTPPILLILDRREDPVTPLLTQWTYQAMVHQILGIDNGRVDLRGVPDIRQELQEIVLSQDQDPFFKKNMFLNFGDLGGNIKDYVEQYQSKTKSNASIESITDMKRFIEEYPEFRKLSGNVSKHVTLVSELSRRVAAGDLLEVSEVEQSLACNDNHAGDLKVCLTFIVRQAFKGLPSCAERAKAHTVNFCDGGLQDYSRGSICSSIREASLERPSNVGGASGGSGKCSTAKSRPSCEVASLPHVPTAITSIQWYLRYAGFYRHLLWR